MITASDVKWGKYKSYEGPYFHGSKKFVLPTGNTSSALRAFDVITRTEGGAPDGVNAYDRCVISVGYLQWCEAAYFLTSKLLAHIADKDASLLDPLKPALDASNAEFIKRKNGGWRFFFKDARGEVDTKIEQTQLFLLKSNGLQGTWDNESKERVKLWVSCMANTLVQPEADILQVEYTVPRLTWFVMPEAKSLLWSEKLPDEGWVGAVRTGFLSFAGNLPAVASEQLQIAVKSTTAKKWSKDWCVAVLKQLTFGPKISIYPGRYDKIRGPLERNYGVDLPDFSSELKAWTAEFDAESGTPGTKEPSFFDLIEIQQLLYDLNYDLGPAGVDGRNGPKTKDAILMFQRLNRLKDDGIIGPKTRNAMLTAWRKKG